MSVSTIFISGPMSGLADYGRENFAKAEAMLRSRGYAVLNPAVLPTDLPGTAYMPICLAMLSQADAVYVLDGWEHHSGCLIEVAFAERQGLPIIKSFTEESPGRKGQ